MAGIAIGRRSAAIAVGVTRTTSYGCMESREREGSRGVVESRRRPGGRAVTGCTRVADVIRNVVQWTGASKVSSVTRITIGRSATAIAVGMAGSASDSRMKSRERERSRGVVESRWCPTGCRMASDACVADAVRDVV